MISGEGFFIERSVPNLKFLKVASVSLNLASPTFPLRRILSLISNSFWLFRKVNIDSSSTLILIVFHSPSSYNSESVSFKIDQERTSGPSNRVSLNFPPLG